MATKRIPDRSLDVRLPDAGTLDRPATMRVMLVERDDSLRQNYRDVLGRAGYEVFSAGSISEARALLDRAPDIHAAVIDYRLPDGTATDLVQALIERRPLCRSVVVTGSAGQQVASETARAGAHAYLRKPNTAPELLDAVSRTIRSTIEWRHAALPPRASNVRGVAADEAPSPVHFDLQRAITRLRFIANLSPAETMTAWRLLWGDSNRRMAELMGCTERTVKFHVAEVLARTGARSRAGLLRVLLEDAGLQDPWEQRHVLGDPFEPSE